MCDIWTIREIAVAERYYAENGDLEVTKWYITEEGYTLGVWLTTQRRVYAGKTSGVLTDEQIEKLEAIGMRWETRHDVAWQQSFEAVRSYKEMNRHLNYRVGYMSEEGYRVGKWLRYQRFLQGSPLSVERTEKLAEISMVFVKENPWEHKFNLAHAYYEEHGNLNMKSNYIVEGAWLAKWLSEQVAWLNGKVTSRSRIIKLLTPEQVKKLETIGIRRE